MQLFHCKSLPTNLLLKEFLRIQKELADDIRQITVVENCVKNDPGLAKMVIANQTCNMYDPQTGLDYEEGGISACTFQDNLTDPSYVTVVFRGTGAGEWPDNGKGLSGLLDSTPQQRQAQEYFDAIVQKNGWAYSKPDIFVTGHSKGGNKTQYVLMTSMYSDLIVNGYSLDGQSMSAEAIAEMRNTLGDEEFEKRRRKLFSVSADNDYVNVLGVTDDGRLIPSDQIYYLKSNLSGVKWHYADCFMNLDGSLTEFTEQGDISVFVQSLSQSLMDLPPILRCIATNGLMDVAELVLGNGKPVNGEELSLSDIMGAIPLVIALLPSSVIRFVDNYIGLDLSLVAKFIEGLSLLVFTPIVLSVKFLGAVIEVMGKIIDEIVELGKKCVELCQKIVEFFGKAIDSIADWFDRHFNSGRIYADSNPQIIINTYRLSSYAQRLENVNRRISALDQRLDSLYFRVGFLDLWNLLIADLLTGYSWKLRRCIDYLNNTASDFESTENELS